MKPAVAAALLACYQGTALAAPLTHATVDDRAVQQQGDINGVPSSTMTLMAKREAAEDAIRNIERKANAKRQIDGLLSNKDLLAQIARVKAAQQHRSKRETAEQQASARVARPGAAAAPNKASAGTARTKASALPDGTTAFPNNLLDLATTSVDDADYQRERG